MADFLMPKLGADMTAGTLVAWHKKPGDAVKRGDIIADVDGQAVDLAERGDSMTVVPERVGGRFWLQWTGASVIVFTSGATVFWGVEKLCEDDPKECLPFIIWTIIFLMVATPALLAFLQWLILRRRLPDAVDWIPTTAGGAIAGIALIVSALFVVDMRASGIPWWFGPMAATGFGGALVGALQWLVLRRWITNGAWWVLVSSLGWIAAASVYLLVMHVMGADVANLPIGAAFIGFAFGAITGLGLVLLLRNSKPG